MELHIVLAVLVIDLGVSVFAVWRSFRTERDLHVAIKHPSRLTGPVK